MAAAKASPAKSVAAPAPAADPGSGASPAPAPSIDPAARRANDEPSEPKTAAEEVAAADEAIEHQIKRAKASVAKKAKPKAQPKPAPATEAAAAEPASSESEESAPAAEGEPEAERETPRGEPSLKRARDLLEAGDLEAAFVEAFGKKPQDFKIDSRRWEEWRKAGDRQKREIKKLREDGRIEFEQRKEKLVTAARELEQRFGGLVKAAEAYKSGDVVEAVRLAFGEDLQTFQKRALAQFHGKNPELEQLRRELRERDERERKQREEQERAARERDVERRQVQYKQGLRAELEKGGDAQLAKLATQPAFIERVFQIQREHYDEASDATLSTVEAADIARQELLERFGEAFGVRRDSAVTEESDQGGSNPASATTGKPRSRTLSQRGAVEASSPGGELDEQALFRKYTELSKAAG